MTNLKKQFGVNVNAEIEGVWVPFAAGIEFRVARYNNPAYIMRLAALRKPYWRELQRNPTPELMTREADTLTKCVAETLLVDWKGVTDDDGNAVPYSKAKALEFLSDPALHDVRDFIFEESQNQARYRDAALEDAAKNS